MVLFIASCLYTFLLLFALRDWKQGLKNGSENAVARLPVSVIVIARDEVDSIANCLRSIHDSLGDRASEMILVDDHSTDGTVEAVRELRMDKLRVLSLADYDLDSFGTRYKKAAQYYAVQEAQYDHILQTDADCLVSAGWVETMTAMLSSCAFVGAPVFIKNDDRILTRWQTFENIGTMLLTQLGMHKGWWTNANGGNMAYRREVFLEFHDQRTDDHASGDDVHLAQWATKYKSSSYIHTPDAVVQTEPAASMGELWSQRLRWATKTKSYQELQLTWLLGLLFLYHIILLSGIIGCLLGCWSWQFVLLSLVMKVMADYIVLGSVGQEYGQSYGLLSAPIFSILHMVYVIWIGVVGIFGKEYNWKGRRVH